MKGITLHYFCFIVKEPKCVDFGETKRALQYYNTYVPDKLQYLNQIEEIEKKRNERLVNMFFPNTTIYEKMDEKKTQCYSGCEMETNSYGLF